MVPALMNHFIRPLNDYKTRNPYFIFHVVDCSKFCGRFGIATPEMALYTQANELLRQQIKDYQLAAQEACAPLKRFKTRVLVRCALSPSKLEAYAPLQRFKTRVLLRRAPSPSMCLKA